MPQGFYTVEQWRRPDKKAKPQWVAIKHLSSDQSITDAIEVLEKAKRGGLFRVVQTQRLIWAEQKQGKLKLRKWHASSPEIVARTAAAFERDGGRWPE